MIMPEMDGVECYKKLQLFNPLLKCVMISWIGGEQKIIDKSGAWYSYGKERIGQGKDNTRDYLKEHAELANEIDAKIRAALGVSAAAGGAGGGSGSADDEEE